MDTHREFAELKERVEALQGNSASWQDTVSALVDLRASVKMLEEKIELSGRFAKIEQEHESWKTLAKYVTVTISILGILLGYFGIQSVDKFLRDQVDKRLAYTEDFGYGASLADKHPTFAIGYLLRCFAVRPFDEPLLITLLSAADNADDWDTMRIVIEELNKHPLKTASFSNGWTYNNIGNAELDLGITDPTYFARARKALENGVQITSADKPKVLWYLHMNLWRYYLAVDDLKHAQQEAGITKGFDPPPDVDSWAKASEWAWFKAFFSSEHKVDKGQIEKMYEGFSQPKS